MEGEWSDSRAVRFTLWGRYSGTHSNRRLCGSQSRSGRFVEEIAPGEIRIPGHPSCSAVTMLTELFGLHNSSVTNGTNWVHWLQKWQPVICVMYCLFVCLFCVQVAWTYICVALYLCTWNTDIYLEVGGDRHILLTQNFVCTVYSDVVHLEC